jgi:type II restriction enzyme
MNLALSVYSGPLVSSSQIARVVTEPWTEHNFYCPSCGLSLLPYPANTKVHDFYSPTCGETFQQKASMHPFSETILGSEYRTTLNSIMTDSHPSLILLHYDQTKWSVEDLNLVHRAYITPSCIIARKPLSSKARRAGWQGCVISMENVPKIGRINVISEGRIRDKSTVLEQWKDSQALLKAKPEVRGWLADVLRCVERCFETFDLSNVYDFESELSAKHPDNHNIRAKIRQQLQVLRDLGFVEFLGEGEYRYIKS